MAKQLQSISLGAAGFMGVNSMDPPLQQDLAFADVANNAVIDKYGRLGARKGFSLQTGDPTPLGGNEVVKLAEWSIPGSDPILFAIGNSKIYRVDTTTTTNDTLTPMAFPGGYTATGNDWSWADFNGNIYFFQAGNDGLMVTTASNAADSLVTCNATSTETTPACPQGGIVFSAYGRNWVAGIPGEEATVYWSDTLIGYHFESGGGAPSANTGSINLSTVWASGYDEITGIAAHNDTIIFFGRNNIVIYSAGGGDPTQMTLVDAMSGVGCVYNDSIVNTGEDVVFLSFTGVKSLARTVLTNTLPTGDLTANIRDKLILSIQGETQGVSAVYSQEETCFIITFQSSGTSYWIDYKTQLEDGKRKCTVWPGAPFKSWLRSQDGTLYVGGAEGMGLYDGYADQGASYTFSYFGPALDFGDSSRIKVMKKMIGTLIGGHGREATIYWGYGYTGAFRSQVLSIDAIAQGEFGEAEYNTYFEYSVGQVTQDAAVNTTGSGEVVRVGLAVEINGGAFSLQGMRVQVIMGRIT